MVADSLDPQGVDAFRLLKYKPTPKQQQFHAATEDEVLFGGSRGGGKTRALVMEGARLCVQYPGIRVLLIRRSFPQLRATVVQELAKVGFCKRLGGRWNSTELELKFPNGSTLKCAYVDSLSDLAQFQGSEQQAILVDELALLIPEALAILKETLRTSNPAVPVIGVRATANPGGVGHSRVKSMFVDACEGGTKVAVDESGRTRRYLPAKVTDNPFVDKGYLAILQAIADPARRAAMLDGNWDSFEGQVFSEWDSARHIVGPRKDVHIPPEWRKFVGIDYGMSAPFAALWVAIDPDGRAWAYRELYERGLSPSEQARRILDAERKANETNVVHWIDPSTTTQVHAAAPSIMEMYWAEGLPCIPADNNRIAGWSTVHAYLAEGPICPFHAALRDRDEWRGATCPRFHAVESTCPNLIKTLPALPYDLIRTEDADSRGDDHVCDAARYCLHSLGAGLRPGFHIPWTTAEDGPRRLTVQELGGPEPLPLIAGKFAGNMNQGLEGTGVSFARDDDGTPPPGSTAPSPFK
jgi:hypothetical protein